jgi:2-amino-4-hydroxy-6-hydroxymethyldihydropteridine diphosphokinase
VTLAYVGLGSNLDDPRRQVQTAFAELDELPETHVLARSPLYRSAPVGYAAQPQFVNAVAQLDTGLGAERLLAELQRIEICHGRQRSFANAPRPLDLDLLLYGSETLRFPGLVVPHPRMHERAFVLRPLLDLDAALEIPGKGRVRELLAGCAAQPVERLVG